MKMLPLLLALSLFPAAVPKDCEVWKALLYAISEMASAAWDQLDQQLYDDLDHFDRSLAEYIRANGANFH